MTALTAPVIGFQGKAYYNTGTYGSPTWALISNVGDIKMTDEADEGELPLRSGGGFMFYVSGLRKIGWEWSSMYDPGDSVLTALRGFYGARTPTEFAFMDQAIATTGASGMRATCMITKFPRQEELSKPMMVDIGVKPTYATNAPSVLTI